MRTKSLLITIICWWSLAAYAQEKVAPTSQFNIEGKVKNKLTLGFKNMTGYATVSLDSLVIYNHLHERKRTVTNIRGVLLKDILNKAVVDQVSPKLLSEYYIVCNASDGYKVVSPGTKYLIHPLVIMS